MRLSIDGLEFEGTVEELAGLVDILNFNDEVYSDEGPVSDGYCYHCDVEREEDDVCADDICNEDCPEGCGCFVEDDREFTPVNLSPRSSTIVNVPTSWSVGKDRASNLGTITYSFSDCQHEYVYDGPAETGPSNTFTCRKCGSHRINALEVGND